MALVVEHQDSHDLTTPAWCYPTGLNARRFKGSLDDACHILADVSSALAYFADKGVVHNDIKPANILYRAADPPGGGGRRASAIVIDFGLSRMSTQKDDSGGGTSWYLPPEWSDGETRGPPADVFSLGVVMLYLLGFIRLPDKGKGWNVHMARQGAPQALFFSRSWLTHIGRQRDKLHDAGASDKETQVRSLVERMLLLDPSARIGAHELALKTLEWAG